jgi:hypothetical protein
LYVKAVVVRYTVVESPYMGFSFNSYTGKKKKAAIDKLPGRMIRITFYAAESLRQPAGFHVRFKLSENESITNVMDRVRKYYARATPTKGRKAINTFNPVYFMVREVGIPPTSRTHSLSTL